MATASRRFGHRDGRSAWVCYIDSTLRLLAYQQLLRSSGERPSDAPLADRLERRRRSLRHPRLYASRRTRTASVVGLIDFAAHEAGRRATARHLGTLRCGRLARHGPNGSAARAHDFRVELDPNPGKARARIKALVHKQSGHRRERADIEAAISGRIEQAKREGKKAADIRDIVGGPDRPLLIDEKGKTKKREKVQRPNLPVITARGNQ